jgi:hypothetical protein
MAHKWISKCSNGEKYYTGDEELCTYAEAVVFGWLYSSLGLNSYKSAAKKFGS